MAVLLTGCPEPLTGVDGGNPADAGDVVDGDAGHIEDGGRPSPMDGGMLPPPNDGGMPPPPTDGGTCPRVGPDLFMSNTSCDDEGQVCEDPMCTMPQPGGCAWARCEMGVWRPYFNDAPPLSDGGQMPPPVDGGQMPPPVDGGQMPPPVDGGQMPPPVDGGMLGMCPQIGPDLFMSNTACDDEGQVCEDPMCTMPQPGGCAWARCEMGVWRPYFNDDVAPDGGMPPPMDAGVVDAGPVVCAMTPAPVVLADHALGPVLNWEYACSETAADLDGSPTPTSSVEEQGDVRIITGNAIPAHAFGAFPNAGNPNPITEQMQAFELPMTPSGMGGDVEGGPWGVALNSVTFHPEAAEYYQNDPDSGWQYEGLGNGKNLGMDCNFAHVQPNGNYHYHGTPIGLFDGWDGTDMLLVGFGADGFPVYAMFGYADPDDSCSGLVPLSSSYRIKTGARPGPGGPGGDHDGSFVEDYEFVEGLGDLDACNGRTGQTPEFGETYHYILTADYPFIPRCTHAAFAMERGMMGGGGPGGGGPPP